MEYIGGTIAHTILSNPIFFQQSIGSISMNITIQCLQTIISTTQEICGFITTIKSSTHHVNINKLLDELDLESEIILLKSLLNDIHIEKYHTQTLAICLTLMKKCILDIHQIIIQINDRVQYNNKLWYIVGSMAYKFDDISVKLISLTKKLDKRKLNLFDVIKINNQLLITPCSTIIDEIDPSVIMVNII